MASSLEFLLINILIGGIAGALFAFFSGRNQTMELYISSATVGVMLGAVVGLPLLAAHANMDSMVGFAGLAATKEKYFYLPVSGGIAGWCMSWINHLNRPQAVVASGASVRRYIGVGVGAGIALAVSADHFGLTAPSWDWTLTAGLGGLVGVGELASRYRDEPVKALLSIPAIIYVLLNAAAAAVALGLGRSLWWAGTDTQNTIQWSQVLSAGLGAMILLRSAVFKVKVGDQDVAIGPSSFLQSVIEAADRAVDRVRAQERAWTVATLMEGIDPAKAYALLPSYLPALMQNLGDDERKKFAADVSGIRDESPELVTLRLGLIIMDHTGAGVLRAALTSLAARIKAEQATERAAVAAEKAASDGVVAAATTAGSAKAAVDAAREAGADSTVQDAARKTAEQAMKAEAAAQTTLARTLTTATIAGTEFLAASSPAEGKAASASPLETTPARSQERMPAAL